MTVALVSLGNELRRDDGIAAELCRHLPTDISNRLTYFELGIHGDQIGSCLEAADGVIVVDALLAPEDVGALQVYDEIPAHANNINASHGLSWFHEIALLGKAVPVTFVGVPIEDDGWGSGFSERVQLNRERLIEQLAAVCVSVLEQPRPAAFQRQSALTGLVGIVVVIICGILTALPEEARTLAATFWPYRKPLILLAVFTAMLLVECLVFKVHRRNFDFGNARVLTAESNRRIGERLISSLACFFMALPVVALLYPWFPLGLPVYAIVTPIAMVALIPYFWLVEKYGRLDGTPDGLLLLGQRIRGCRASQGAGDNDQACKTLIQSVLLRAFFIPVMLFSCFHFWQKWEVNSAVALQGSSPVLLGAALFQLIIAADVTLAVLGYATSSRLLDTQIRWVDDKFSGWFFALICYPPFGLVLDNAVWSKVFDVWPQQVFSAHPLLGSLAFASFIVLTAIYCWANASFGLRFSNLCNRGLVDCGPYKFVRHPSYASKNLAWWIGSLYLLFVDVKVFAGVALLLLLINWIYYMRAVTEERHLIRDPDYRNYCCRVPYRFIPGVI